MSWRGIFRKAGINIENNTFTFDKNKDMVVRLRSSLETGSIRGIYNILTLEKASVDSQVEGIKSQVVVEDVTHGEWINAITGAIDFSDTGASHGMAASICAEMIPPNSSLVYGSLYALDCNFGCGESASWGSAGPVAFIKFENWGTKGYFTANAFLFHLIGETGGSGDLLSANERTLKVLIGSTTKYLYLSDTEDDLGSMVVDNIVLSGAEGIGLLISTSTPTFGISITAVCETAAIQIGSAGVSAGDFIIHGEAAGTYLQYDADMDGDNKGRLIVAGSSARFTCPSTKNISAVAITQTVDQPYSDTSGAHGLWSTCVLDAHELSSADYTHYAGVHGDVVISATLNGAGVHVYGVLGEIRGTGTQTVANIVAAVAAKYNNSVELGTGDSCLFWGWSHAGVVDFGLLLEASDSGSLITGISIPACTTGISLASVCATGIRLTYDAGVNGAPKAIKTDIIVNNGNLNGYGTHEYLTYLRGVSTGSMVCTSNWLSTYEGTHGATGYFLTPMANGIYLDNGTTVTDAVVIYGMKMDAILNNNNDAFVVCPFSINVSGTQSASTALFYSPTIADTGYAPDASEGTTKLGQIPIAVDSNGTLYYVRVYESD